VSLASSVLIFESINSFLFSSSLNNFEDIFETFLRDSLISTDNFYRSDFLAYFERSIPTTFWPGVYSFGVFSLGDFYSSSFSESGFSEL
jgi:hypothetical protein